VLWFFFFFFFFHRVQGTISKLQNKAFILQKLQLPFSTCSTYQPSS
jgi:hypothetical protein